MTKRKYSNQHDGFSTVLWIILGIVVLGAIAGGVAFAIHKSNAKTEAHKTQSSFQSFEQHVKKPSAGE